MTEPVKLGRIEGEQDSMGRKTVRSLSELLVRAVVALLVGRGVEAQTIDPSWVVTRVMYMSGTAAEQELVGALPNSVALPVGNHLAIVGNNAKVFFIDQSGNVTMEKPPSWGDPSGVANLEQLNSAATDGSRIYMIYHSSQVRPGTSDSAEIGFRKDHLAVRHPNGEWEELLPPGNEGNIGFNTNVVVNSRGEVAYALRGYDIFGEPGFTGWVYRLNGRNAGQLVRLTTGYYGRIRSAEMTESGEIFLAGPPRRSGTDAVMSVVRLDGSIQEYAIKTGVEDPNIGDVRLARGPGDKVMAYTQVRAGLCLTEFSGTGSGYYDCLYHSRGGHLGTGIGGDPFDDISVGEDYVGMASDGSSRMIRLSATTKALSDDQIPLFNEGGRDLDPNLMGSRRMPDGSVLSVGTVKKADRSDGSDYWAVLNWKGAVPEYHAELVKSAPLKGTKKRKLPRKLRNTGVATFRVGETPGPYSPIDCSYPPVRYAAYAVLYESEGGELSPEAKVVGVRQLNFYWFDNFKDVCTKQQKDFSPATIGYPLARKGKRIWACLDCTLSEPLSTRRAKSVMLN